MIATAGPEDGDRPILVFDVNETLLDIDALEPLFEAIFGKPPRLREWFAQLVLYSQALSLSGRFAPFEALGAGVLKMLGEIHGVAVSDADVRALGQATSTMPLHPDVAPALERLAGAGFRMVTLTNSSGNSDRDPLAEGGVADHFEHRFTVASIERFKPSPATYRQVTDTLSVGPERCMLIAAHTWDTLGAQAMGWKAALITRGANAPLNVENVPVPDMVATDLAGLSSALIAANVQTFGERP